MRGDMIRALVVGLLTVALFSSGPIGPGVCLASPVSDANAGVAAYNEGDCELAVRMYSKALDSRRLRPEQAAVVHSNRSAAYDCLGRTEDALADANAAVSLAPNVTENLYNRSNVLLSLGRLEEALADLARTLELDPEHAKAHFSRGEIWRRKGMPGAAASEFIMAVNLNNDPEAKIKSLHGLGLIDLNKGRYKEALARFNEVLKLQPDYALALANRSLAHEGLGQLKAALTDIEQSYDLEPTPEKDRRADMLRKRIEAGPVKPKDDLPTPSFEN